MAADTFPDSEPYSILRSTVHGSANTYRELTIPTWAQTITIESESGGSDLLVAITGSDGGALGSHYVTVAAGGGPREWDVGVGLRRFSSLYIASATGGAAYVAEAEAEDR